MCWEAAQVIDYGRTRYKKEEAIASRAKAEGGAWLDIGKEAVKEAVAAGGTRVL